MRCSSSGSPRQWSNCCAEAFGYDKNDRQRGSDEGDSPLLGDGEDAAGDAEVVEGGEKGDQAEGQLWRSRGRLASG